MPSMDTVLTSLGDVRSHTRKVCEEIANRFGPLYFIWGIGNSGEHAEGRALDFMTYERGGGVNSPGPIRVQLGWDIANYLWSNRVRLGVWYVIYRQQIISTNDNRYGVSGKWNSMPDRGGPTANHMDHPHVSLLNSPPAYQPPTPPAPDKDWFDMADPTDLRKIVDDALDAKLGPAVEAAIEAKRPRIAGIVLNTDFPTGVAHLDSKAGGGGRHIPWFLRDIRNKVSATAEAVEKLAKAEVERAAVGSTEREELLAAVADLRAALDDDHAADADADEAQS